MPLSTGEHPYEALTRTMRTYARARTAFAYFDSGQLGTNWALHAPPEVAVHVPELLDDAAEALLSGRVADTEAVIFLPTEPEGEYANAAEKAAALSGSRWVFVLIVEGYHGTRWSVHAPPDERPELIADAIHGAANDIRRDESRRRMDMALEVPDGVV